MDLIFSFPGGETCRGFFMVSLLVEMAASSGITVSTVCSYVFLLFFPPSFWTSAWCCLSNCALPFYMSPPHTACVLVPYRSVMVFFFNSNQGALEVMHAMKISDLIGIQKGLSKVTQSLKKMKETFKLMHSKFELNPSQSEFNRFACWAFYGGKEIQGN